jgi:hypothetical protein
MLIAVSHRAQGWVRFLEADDVLAERGPDWMRIAFPSTLDDGLAFQARLTSAPGRWCGHVVIEGRRLLLEGELQLVSATFGAVEGRSLTWSGLRGDFAPALRVAPFDPIDVFVQDDGRLAESANRDAPSPVWTPEDVAAMTAFQVRRHSGPATAEGRTVTWLGPDARTLVVDTDDPERVAALATQLAPAKPALGADRLVALVRPTDQLRPGAVSRPLADGLHLVLARDLPEEFEWLSAAGLAEDGLTEDEAFRVAVHNLAAHVPWVRLAGDSTARMVVAGGNHEPSLLLDPEVEAAAVAVLGEQLVARLVTHDLLYFTTPEHPERVAGLESIAADFRARGQEWCPAWLSRGPGGWVAG